jgi:hypothetical protein
VQVGELGAGQNCRVRDIFGDTLCWPTLLSMITEPAQPPRGEPSLELPVEEALRRSKPLPPHEEMVIEGLTDEEGRLFLEAAVS